MHLELLVDFSSIAEGQGLNGASTALFGNPNVQKETVFEQIGLNLLNQFKELTQEMNNLEFTKADFGKVEIESDSELNEYSLNKYEVDSEEESDLNDESDRDFDFGEPEDSEKLQEREILDDPLVREIMQSLFSIIGTGGNIQTIMYNKPELDEGMLLDVLTKMSDTDILGVKFTEFEDLNNATISYLDLDGEQQLKYVKSENGGM